MGTGLRLPLLIGAILILGGLALFWGDLGTGGTIGLILIVAGLILAVLPLAVAWLLRRHDPSGWLITWDVFEPLQFGAYVGHKLGLTPADGGAPQAPLEREWQQWWNSLTAGTFEYQAGLEATLRTYSDMAPHQLIQLIHSPASLPYDPPRFASLMDTPALQAFCQEQWPDFTALWALEKPRLFAKLRRQGTRVPDNRIVQRAARMMGRSEVQPFFLRIDFVRWPEVHQRQWSPSHLVLGTHYLEPSAAKALEELMLTTVRDLV